MLKSWTIGLREGVLGWEHGCEGKGFASADNDFYCSACGQYLLTQNERMHKSAKFFILIDGPELRKQRALIMKMQEHFSYNTALSDEELELLTGIENMLDNVADIAHDYYNKDCLFTEANDEETK